MFVKRDSKTKDVVIKVCMGVVVCITAYLLIFFFIYQEGCEELIKFWVLSNLIISIVFTGLRMLYILAKQGKDGLKNAISKKRRDISLNEGGSSESDREKRGISTVKLNGDDYYQIAFYGYSLM